MNLSSDFTLDPRTGVMVPREGGAPAGYLDGAERYLLEALQVTDDRSVASAQLRRHVKDWPSLYHLTPYRSTLFDALGFHGNQAKVLELGCGCGAVTRWLGENTAEVHAIEGNIERAGVARARTADLDNVHIFSANYSELETAGAYDIVTLIGVLEYGHLYHPEFAGKPWESALDNLKVAYQALSEGSVLLLAIENKLGLKYFNGAREDHSGRLFESVQGYPHAPSAVTFSARELELLLGQAGFDAVDFYLPFPDYKLATTVINPAQVTDADNIHNWLPTPAPDRGNQRTTAFYNEALVYRELQSAGILRDLSNSFFIVAYRGDKDTADARLGIQSDWKARHYSLDRRPGLRKRITLPAAPAGEPVVMSCEPSFEQQTVEQVGPVRHHLASEQWADGQLLVFDIFETIAGLGIGEHFLGQVRELRRWLIDTYATGLIDHDDVPLLHGSSFDAVWWNIVVGKDGTWTAIDSEWEITHPLPVDYIIWRALYQAGTRWNVHFPGDLNCAPAAAFADAILPHIEPDLDGERLGYLQALESTLAEIITVDAPPNPSDPVIAKLAGSRKAALVGVDADEIIAQPALLEQFAGAFTDQDPVTLHIICDADREDEQIAALEAAAAGLGEDPDLPDILVRAGSSGARVQLTGDLDAAREQAEQLWADHQPEPSSAASAGTSRKLGVVLAFNDEDIILETVEHLLDNGHEVIVWDNGSTDGTWEKLQGIENRLLELTRRDDLGLYEIYGAMSQHIIDRYVQDFDWVSWPDSDEILLGDDLSESYEQFVEKVLSSQFDWVQFHNWNFWWTDQDDTSVASPVERIRHYALFRDCAPRVRAWRASASNIREFNHNPADGTRYPFMANLCHYPMRGEQQAAAKLKTRDGIQRGEQNWHYNKMQRDPSVLRIDAGELEALTGDPRQPGTFKLNQAAPFNWRTIYDR